MESREQRNGSSTTAVASTPVASNNNRRTAPYVPLNPNRGISSLPEPPDFRRRPRPPPASITTTSDTFSTGSDITTLTTHNYATHYTTTNSTTTTTRRMNSDSGHSRADSAQSNTNTASGKKKKKKKKRRWRWIVGKPRDLTPEQEQVFMTMKLRKLNRALTGTKTKQTKFQLFALVAYFVLAFGVLQYSSQESAGDKNCNGDNNDNNNNTRRIIVLDLGDIIMMMVYILAVLIVTNIFRESKFITLLYWMFIYLPLAAMILGFMLGDTDSVDNFLGTHPIVLVMLIVAEIAVLVTFLSLYKLYPKLVQSAWFRRKSRAGIFWRIKVVSDWTMTYVGSWGKRYSCKYDGETNQLHINSSGLPHGLGRWLDDSYSGEVLTGTWINGIPVAPFASRQFGTGDAFKAVRVGYVMASDDEYTTTKFWPSNDKPPRIGLTSVECSISGSFYNELPLATHLAGPNWLDEGRNSVGNLCSQLTHIDDEEERGHQLIQIKASDPRGVQVRGHVYASTGESFNAGLNQVIIHVDKDEQEPLHRPRLTPGRSLNFMPRASRQSFRPERIILCDESDSGEDETDERNFELATVEEELSHRDMSLRESPVRPQTPPLACRSVTSASSFNFELMSGIFQPFKMTNASLRVEDWTPAEHKDALIFFPGYKVPLKQSLEALGQFIAMTRLDSRVYPIIFGWPCGQRFTYHSASRKSATAKNRENLLRLIQGLQKDGIRHVHFMTHSMGVQTLLGAFSNLPDGSPSELSKLFQLDPDFVEEDVSLHQQQQQQQQKQEGTSGGSDSSNNMKPMICRTITMLNPDFPLEAFVDRAFASVRRICSCVTIIGDRHDKALFGSQIMNGIGVYFGYEQPEVLQPKPTSELSRLSEREVYFGKHLFKQEVIGFAIESLYYPKDVDRDELNEALLFKERAPVIVCTEEEDVQDRAWLDVDVIDTTGLDTNIAGIRHSGFNLNPILLKDLEELISTGRRAVNRATLLYRDGNNFSYCHAPSYVAM